jgi:hypothetical protein
MKALLHIEGTDNMVFDGLDTTCWHVALIANVHTARIRNMFPGQRYTFIFKQSNLGKHIFTWPPACVNGLAVSVDPNTLTIQNFIADTGGILRAHHAGTWRTA